MSDHKNTEENKYPLNLLDTDFAMRAGLDKKAPGIISSWEQEIYITANGDKIIGRYNILRYLAQAEGREKFILHDGPPYANGELHIGHAVNKILKDIVVKYKTVFGYDAPYTPGWDCHGLPIELNVEKEYAGTNANATFLRRQARRYAQGQIENQKADFKSLGVLGDWDNPYKTMDFATEGATVKAIADIARNGYLQQGYKPVHWCLDCQSALAEAEVEYADLKSPSLYVGFRLTDESLQQLLQEYDIAITEGTVAACFIIWTTTTYTLPGNQAISMGNEIEYVIKSVCFYSPLDVPHTSIYIVSKEFADSQIMRNILKASCYYGTIDTFDDLTSCGGKDYNNVQSINVENNNCLKKLKYTGLDGEVKPVIVADHVTTDAGTGLVHTAPAHGVEDFVACKKAESERGLDFDYSSPIGQDGYYVEKWQKILTPYKDGQRNIHVKDIADDNTNKKSKKNLENPVLKFLTNSEIKESPVLLHISETSHRATICWRHKTPLITMATPQWFIELERKTKAHNNSIREMAIKAVNEEIQFSPSWGRERLLAMVKNRPDWCVSRQRNWGTPLPFIIDTAHGTPLGNNPEDKKSICKFSTWYVDDIICSISAKGIDAWHDLDLAKDILQPDVANNYKKSADTLDVWFDSGSTIATVVNTRAEFKTKNAKPDEFIQADLYLEGSDQHRGWFQSSLLISLALYGKAPYKQLLTHGFLVDDKGHKMSKSIGNIVSIKEANRKYGPELVRLWVASSDYSNDIAYSEEIMKRVTDQYRRIRNTIRFFLSNLKDFNKDMQINYDNMLPLDRYAIHNFRNMSKKVQHNFNEYQFHLAVQELVSYCSEDLGGFYLDVLKDRLYTLKIDSVERRSAQTALYFIIHDLLILISPILSFTSDEAWQCLFAKEGYYHFHHNKNLIPTIIGNKLLNGDDVEQIVKHPSNIDNNLRSLFAQALRKPAGIVKLFSESADLQTKIEGYAKIAGMSTIYNTYNDLCAMHIAKSPFNLSRLIDEGNNIDNMSCSDFITQADNVKINEFAWEEILQIRSAVLKQLEESRIAGAIGSSLQAEVDIEISAEVYNNLLKVFNIPSCNHSDASLAESSKLLGEQLKFIFIVSKVDVNIYKDTDNLYKNIVVNPSKHSKCVRCWHYHETVGKNSIYLDICDRCVSNL
jgi:isoleucyl-tRNA synthetase